MDQQPEFILQFFGYKHLPEKMQAISKPFHDLAHQIVNGKPGFLDDGTAVQYDAIPRNPERTVALRKLLEAKDAAVRATIAKEE